MNDILTIGSFKPKNDYLWVTWSILLSCNYNCRYCYVRNKGFASKDVIDDTIRFLRNAPQKVKDVTLFGGEPTIHRQLFYIIEQLKDFVRNLYIFTNLSSTNTQLLNLVNNDVQFCISYHPDIISDVAFIKKLDYLLQIHGKIEFLNIMMTQDKESEIESVAKYCREHSIRHRLLPIYMEGGRKDWVTSVRYSRRRDVVPVRNVMVIRENQNMTLSEQECITLNMTNFKGFHCYAGCRSVFITHDGTVYRCQQEMRNHKPYCTVRDDYPKLEPYICPYEECTCEYYIPKEIKLGLGNDLLDESVKNEV